MEITTGYKHTDYGIIPSNWAFMKIQSLIDNNVIISHLDGNHGALYPRSQEFKESGVPYIAANDFITGEVSFRNCKYLSEERASEFQKGIARDGDVLFAHNATVGPVALLRTTYDYVVLSTTATYYRCDNNRLVNGFLQYALRSDFFAKQYKAVMAQSTRFQVPITAQRKFYLAIPPRQEQTAIANALGDADALIGSMEKLIAKKRNIKQGAMQQLLQPKEGWEVKKLGEIASFHKGKGLPKSEIADDGKIKCIHYGELFTRYSEVISKIYSSTNTEYNAFYSKSNDVLMPTSDVTPNGLATASCVNEGNILLGGDVMVIRIDPNILDGIFLSYYITQNKENVMKLVSGSTVYHLYGSDMKGLEVVYPDIETQRQFVNILTGIDAEITALEAKLQKYKQIRQGMMQQLLTGKIRLVG